MSVTGRNLSYNDFDQTFMAQFFAGLNFFPIQYYLFGQKFCNPKILMIKKIRLKFC